MNQDLSLYVITSCMYSVTCIRKRHYFTKSNDDNDGGDNDSDDDGEDEDDDDSDADL